jgi:dienelactone hydrolase
MTLYYRGLVAGLIGLFVFGACHGNNDGQDTAGQGVLSGDSSALGGGNSNPGTTGSKGGSAIVGTGGNTGNVSGSSAIASKGSGGKIGGQGGAAGKTVSKAGAGGASGAGTSKGGGTAGSGGASASTGPSPFGNIQVEDLAQNGPYASTTTNFSGPNGNYTIYHPRELGTNGVKHPVVNWMSGGSTNPAMYPLLPHLATHGFVVVASNTTPTIGAQVALGQEMVAGLDWILEQNKTSGSPFFGKIDETKIGAMGYSMGGLATTTIVDDPRLTTTVHVSGGTGNQGGIEKFDKLHAPAAFLCGGTTGDSSVDIAGDNCKLDFDYIKTQSVFYGKFHGDHLCSLMAPCQTWLMTAQTGWLRWQLMNDQPLKAMFVGEQCGLCKDSNWTVQQKNLK